MTTAPEQAAQQPLSCEEVEDFLPLIADGVLDEADAPDVFAHIARCPRCQESLALYDTVDLAVALAADQPAVEKPLQFIPATAGKIVAWLAAAAVLLTGGWLTLRPAVTVTGNSTTGQHARVLQVVESAPGQQSLVVQHPDGSIEVVDDLDQPRNAGAPPADELRPATGNAQAPNAWRAADK